MGSDHYLIQSSVPLRSLTNFWRVLHLIFIHNIDPRLHHPKCTIHLAWFMLMVRRMEPIDHPLYMFLVIPSEAQPGSAVQGLPYGLMLSHILVDVGFEVRRHEPMSKQLSRSTIPRLVVVLHKDWQQFLVVLHNMSLRFQMLRSWSGLPLEQGLPSRHHQLGLRT